MPSALEVIQVGLNATVVVAGGVVWKMYFENLRATIGSKEAEISLLSAQVEFKRERISELENRTPEAVERVLSERIQIREREIERLKSDQESSAQDVATAGEEVDVLRRTLNQMKGFREVLAMEWPDPSDPEYDELVQYLNDRQRQVVDIEVVYMGSAFVDSGQLMITDPCYIDQYWADEPFESDRVYRDSQSGNIVRWGDDFRRFDEVLEPYGETPNDLIAGGRLVKLPPASAPDHFNYSYNGACQATLGEGFGELQFPDGVAGAGVVFRSGWGDGLYPVYGEIHDGRIVRIFINAGADPALLAQKSIIEDLT